MITIPSGSAGISLTLEQLLLLHKLIRHEMDGQEKWDAPPANHDLNYKIMEAILACVESDEDDASTVTAPLVLNYRDCLSIDYVAPILHSAKDVSGNSIGQDVLMRVFVARREIYQPWTMAEAPEEGPQFSDVQHKMEEFTNANPDNNADPHHSRY